MKILILSLCLAAFTLRAGDTNQCATAKPACDKAATECPMVKSSCCAAATQGDKAKCPVAAGEQKPAETAKPEAKAEK